MDKIAICTLFRDCTDDVRRSFMERSRWHYDQAQIIHVCIEGDSVDDTYKALRGVRGFNTVIDKIDQGGEKFKSHAEPSRLANLAALWNRALDLAFAEKPHYTFILDSDISTPPDLLPRLIAHKKDVIAPMMFFENSIFFRDTWAYRGSDGTDFTNRPRYHIHYRDNQIFEVASVGLPLMHYEVLKTGVRCTDQEVVGLCHSIRSLDFKIWVDPKAVTYHPRLGIEVPPHCER